jgi:hypothetical protein
MALLPASTRSFAANHAYKLTPVYTKAHSHLHIIEPTPTSDIT